MKIEVDTKHDSREELSALADMLQRLSRSSGSGAISTYKTEPAKPKNIFEDSSPSVGMFNMFNDGPSTSTSAPAPTTMSASEPQPAQNEPASGGLFSLFGDDPKPDIPSEPAQSMSVYDGSPTVTELLSGQSEPEEPKEEVTTSVRDLLDDDSIIPY